MDIPVKLSLPFNKHSIAKPHKVIDIILFPTLTTQLPHLNDLILQLDLWTVQKDPRQDERLKNTCVSCASKR